MRINEKSMKSLLGMYSVMYPQRVELITYVSAGTARIAPWYLGSMFFSFLSTIVIKLEGNWYMMQITVHEKKAKKDLLLKMNHEYFTST